MFKKKPNIKPLSPLRSSDRRKLADQIIADLSLPVPPAPAADASQEDKAAAAAELGALRNSLLPENVQSARFATTHGPELRPVSGTVYVGPTRGGEQRVLWVRVQDGRLFPTVYTLWNNPRIVPLLHTPELVVTKIQGGADLMTPGLANRPPFPAGAKKGALVAVASMQKPSVPVAVGTCEIDISELGNVQGSKGVAVQIATWFGDELWVWSTSGKGGGDPPDNIDAWLGTDEDVTREVEEGTAALSLDDAPKAAESATKRNRLGGEDSLAGEAEEREWTTPDIDDAFRKAFMFGVVKHKVNGSPPRYGLDFPLNQSYVMSHLVQPYLPIFTKSDTDALQIKKTSWKNIRKFIKALDKDKFIMSKERNNEATIEDIDFEDRRFASFQPYKLPKKESSANKGGKPAEAAGSDSDPSVGQKLKLLHLYKPKSKHSELFSKDSAGSYLTAAEVKEAVSKYIEAEKLVPPNNKRQVTLNPFLANSVLDGSQQSDKVANAKGSVTRDALADRVLSSCSPYHLILRNTSAPESSSKPRAGAGPRVTIVLEIRSGKKTVTKVSGLEPFFILPQPLAEELRKKCAGSTSVEPLVGSSPKNPVMEVMVQGPQSQEVLAALEKRGVDRKWVDVVDKTKKKK